jgi:hypothetical protein
MPRIHRLCRDCGLEFYLSERAQRFFVEERALELPVRCFECRQARRLSREIQEHEEWRAGNGRTSDGG